MEAHEQCTVHAFERFSTFERFSRTLKERYNYNPKKFCSMTDMEIFKSNTILVRCT